MQKRKRNFKKLRYVEKSTSDNHINRKIVFSFVFLVLTIFVILYAYSPDLTNRAVLSFQLDKQAYSANEKITGTIALRLEEGDVLPEDSKIKIAINSNEIKCQQYYLCSGGREVQWHFYNSTTGNCELVNPDPESDCIFSGDSYQVIINSEFEKLHSSTTKPASWAQFREGVNLLDYYGTALDENGKRSVFLNTINQTSSSNSYVNLSQNFGRNNFSVTALAASPEIAVNPIIVRNNGTGILYNITICNTGRQTAEKFNNSVQISIWRSGTSVVTADVISGNPISLEGYQTVQSYYYNITNLASGQCNLTKAYIKLDENGKYKINVSANIDNLYIEDRTNNKREIEVDYTKTYVVDLTAGIINSYFEYNPTRQLYQLKYNVSVCNEGTQTVSNIRNFFNSTNGTTIVNTNVEYVISSLNSGKCNYSIMQTNIFLPENSGSSWTGFYNASLMTDVAKSIVEDYENNNYAVKNESMRPFDLYFKDFSITKINDNRLNYSFWICKRNLSSSFYVNITFYRNERNPTISSIFQDSGVYYVPPTQCAYHTKLVNVETIPSCSGALCSHIYPSMKIDSAEKLKESNEMNNTAYVTLNVPGEQTEESMLSSESEKIEGKQLLFQTSQFSEDSTLFWKLGYNLIYGSDLYSDDGCAFEIIVNGSNTTMPNKELHYYYSLNSNCPMPSNTSEKKYIPMAAPALQSNGLISDWENYSRDLFEDWKNSFGQNSINDKINGIFMINYGKKNGNNVYGQILYVDYIKLFKGTVPSEDCTVRGKQCCLTGTGNGKYYGEQLTCNEGYSCWEKCSSGVEMTLEEFIEKSGSTKENKTTGTLYGGECSIKTSSGIIGLGDLCIDETLGGVGEGYAACLDTSSSSSVSSCRGWDNIYSFNLSRLNLYTPNQNGTYNISVMFTYYSETFEYYGDNPNIYVSLYESSLIVGTGYNYTDPCPITNYTNCTTTHMGECINNYRTVNRTCYYNGTNPACPATKQTSGSEYCVINDSQIIACTERDWSCGLWDECLGGSQSRTCNKITNCDAQLPNSYVPEQQRACSEELPPETKINWLLYVGIILGLGILTIIFYFVFVYLKTNKIKIFKSSEKKTEIKTEANEYPELNNYIKDALATGMQEPEIKSKLQEAGWPKDLIDKAFKKFR